MGGMKPTVNYGYDRQRVQQNGCHYYCQRHNRLYIVIVIIITIDLFCRLIEEQERQPDVWFRYQCGDMWRENKLAVSEFLRSNPDNLVFVHNTTTGCQTKLAIDSCMTEPDYSLADMTYKVQQTFSSMV